MFSDTHCHLSHLDERGENLGELLGAMAAEKFPFVLDIGTRPGDLALRLAKIRAAGDIPDFLHFSCGLWPDGEIIAHRDESLKILETDIKMMIALAATRAEPGTRYIGALGECGLDRYWNGPAAAERVAAQRAATQAAARAGEQSAGSGNSGGTAGNVPASDDGPGTLDLHGEEELFAAQLDMARAYKLAVIVHSREAFGPTLGCIRDADYDRGVIHCFAYDIEEARAFLDRGWYISFPGNITWAKKEADRGRIARLIRFVPRDRLLLETDAPYLTPAPHRGKTNTPLLIRHTYERAADILGMETAALASLVHANARELFAVT